MLLLPPIMTREHRGTARNDVSPWLGSALCSGTMPMTTGYLHNVRAAGASVTNDPWWLFPVCLWGSGNSTREYHQVPKFGGET